MRQSFLRIRAEKSWVIKLPAVTQIKLWSCWILTIGIQHFTHLCCCHMLFKIILQSPEIFALGLQSILKIMCHPGVISIFHCHYPACRHISLDFSSLWLLLTLCIFPPFSATFGRELLCGIFNIFSLDICTTTTWKENGEKVTKALKTSHSAAYHSPYLLYL